MNLFTQWRDLRAARAAAGGDETIAQDPDALSGDDGGGEAALVARARRGDRNAFDALVRTHHDPLAGFLARRLGGNVEAAADIVQETLLAAWGALPKFDGRSRFKTWLYGIALHKCADHARREKRRGEITQAVGGDVAQTAREEAAGGHSVEDLYIAAQLREAVQALLVQLPPSQREVIEMYYYADLTLPEIAQALKRNLNTVKYQFYRAHAVVARALEMTSPASSASGEPGTLLSPQGESLGRRRGPFPSAPSEMSFRP